MSNQSHPQRGAASSTASLGAPRAPVAAAIAASLLASACGGGSGSAPSAAPSTAAPAELASATTVLDLPVTSLPDEAAQQAALPGFHVAPVVLDPPEAIDATDNAASAARAPRSTPIPLSARGLSTARLTLEAIHAWTTQPEGEQAGSAGARGDGRGIADASTGAATTYTPAQIRAAYGLPALPAAGTTPSAAQAAQMGAGQTIYLIDADDDPNVVAELSAFNQTFGLPACTTVTIATATALPLAAPSSTACQFAKVYATASGTMTASAPAYNSGWATEITLDVQWAHATAPLARIILIEAPDASLASLTGAVELANAMGPGIVSMSFGSPEGAWTASVDSTFTAPNMSYLAATGDSGAGVQWPSVSTHVLGVGGTSLTYSGSGARSEVAWSDTGGGISQYVAAPSYQSSAVPGMGAQSYRNVADVAFNADPNTGQYLAVIAPGSSSVSWLSAGGTSLATPQWAGLLAIANAQRVASAKPLLGDPHAPLYAQVAAVPGTYAGDIADITKGSDGSCATCVAKVGYDTPTGIGTPNASSLAATLAGIAAPVSAPVVTPEQITGSVGTALSFTVSVSAPDALSFALSGAPSGMSIAATGVVTWATPVAGTYPVTVTAKDAKTGLSGQGVYTVTIAAPTPPVVAAASVAGRVGVALSYAVSVTSADALSYTLSGAPAGMTISTAGVLGWSSPLAGTYKVTVSAKDSRTGLTGTGLITITISTAAPPVVAGGSVPGKPGTALSFTVAVTAPDAVTIAIKGQPSGMAIGGGGLVTWPSPVAGTYSVTAVATDTKTGLSGQGVYTVVVTAGGPVITAPPMTGVAGKPLTGTIALSDPGVAGLSVQISGVPLGMMFSASGLNLIAQWPSPVTGSYTLVVSVVDSNGARAQANVPVTITAH